MFNLARSLLYFMAAFFCFTQCDAKEVFLFDEHKKPVSDYNKIIKTISAHDHLHFFNGKSFDVVSILGDGGTSRVYEVTDDQGSLRALRVPIQSDNEYVETINCMVQAYEETFSKIPGFPIVPILEFEKSEYIVHEIQKDLITYNDFLRDFKEKKYSEDYKLWIDLKKFALQTAMFRIIGDLRSEQVLYTKTGWMILDWLDHSQFAKTVNDPTVFSISRYDAIPVMIGSDYNSLLVREESLYLPQKQRKEIIQIIADQRTQMGLPPGPESIFKKCQQFLVKYFKF